MTHTNKGVVAGHEDSVTAEISLIEGFDAARDLPGAHVAPGPSTEFKVVFDLVINDEILDEPYPMLALIAFYMSTWVNFPVPAEIRRISIDLYRYGALRILIDLEQQGCVKIGLSQPRQGKCCKDTHF